MIGGAYSTLVDLGSPLVSLYMRRRLAAGREDPRRIGERFGEPGRARPPGRLAWVHAASVGEALSALALIERLLRTRPGLSVLVTTGTVTSATLLAQRLPEGAFHQYVPVDQRRFVDRFLDHWRPDLALWIESELWPNLVGGLRRRRIPAALLNARLSPRSHARWRLVRPFARSLLSAFQLCLAQSEPQARLFADLGATGVDSVGNLKYAAAPLPADPARLAALTEALAGRPAWVAASTHPGEEAQVAEAHARLVRADPRTLTILVPRHPERGAAIAAALAHAGIAVTRRATGALPDAGTACYVADTLGELGLFYRAAPVAFVGGSLVPHGGQNPLEAAKVECAVVLGPHTHNFREITAELDAAGATVTVRDAAGLGDAVAHLLADPLARAEHVAAGRRVAAVKDEILDRFAAALARLLDPLVPAVAGA